ncbi:MAG: nucleotidyltransferase domain-containing protein [Candidatus Xenobia bacterium]
MLPPRDGLREVEAALKPWTTQVVARFSPASIVLTGSRARGTHFRDSDIDILVVAGGFDGVPTPLRIEALLEGWHSTPALEPIGVTPTELANDSLYLWDALSDGRILVDDGTFLAARQRHHSRIARGELTRTAGGWRDNTISLGG